MALSNTDTYENRKKLEEYIEDKGSSTFIMHGYNGVKGSVIADYSKIKTESDGLNRILKIKIEAELPASKEYLIASIPSTIELQSAIDLQVDQFFSNQQTIDGGPDE